MVTNIMFMIVMITTENGLKVGRNEFKEGLFSKMADDKRNFLW